MSQQTSYHTIRHLIVAGIGDFGYFSTLERVEQELRNNSLVYNRIVPAGCTIYYYDQHILVATAYPIFVFD